ncbi:hypothetical protein D791_01680 [Nitrincola nitratireducens]|uniref:Uncharacterized protein n=1 Tax=Nitrincola nitratireducens TaxID=1229521 RepID=W9UWC3_9GAMM|nr:hypothetical protein D791_01680 [Nitrincola nitratireducens]
MASNVNTTEPQVNASGSDNLALMKQNAAEAARLLKALGNDSRYLFYAIWMEKSYRSVN